MDSGLLSFIKGNKMLWRVGLFIALGIALIIISSAFDVNASSVQEADSLDEYKEKLEERLAELCSEVEGVGKCRVLLTFERGEQSTYKNGVIIENKPPKVMGVTIVCQGADYDYVRRELTDMATALFDIGSNHVSILKLN